MAVIKIEHEKFPMEFLGDPSTALINTNISESHCVPVIRITEGRKLFMPNQERCLDIEKKLNELGVQTRVGHNIEADLWSIYIISVPESKIGTYEKI